MGVRPQSARSAVSARVPVVALPRSCWDLSYSTCYLQRSIAAHDLHSANAEVSAHRPLPYNLCAACGLYNYTSPISNNTYVLDTCCKNFNEAEAFCRTLDSYLVRSQAPAAWLSPSGVLWALSCFDAIDGWQA
jgi:hypothetical protein